MKRAQQGHLRGHERIGRGAHFVVALEQQLPQAVQLARAKVCRPAFERGAFLGGAGLSFRAADLGDGDLVDEIELGASSPPVRSRARTGATSSSRAGPSAASRAANRRRWSVLSARPSMSRTCSALTRMVSPSPLPARSAWLIA
jgi:hypothetical protein